MSTLKKYCFANQKIQLKYSKTNFHLLFFIHILTLSLGCKKMLEIDPPIERIAENAVYTNTSSAAAVLTGLYYDISERNNFGALAVQTGLSSDELSLFSSTSEELTRFYSNTLITRSAPPYWTDFYAYIFRLNSAIEGISASAGIPNVSKQQLLGEAKFLRAMLLFYLTNLYGDIPIVLSSDYKINSTIEKKSSSKVYEQIIIDLTEAKAMLNEQYLSSDVSTSTTERLRPNRATATALLARVYLYNAQWKLAEEMATEIINNPNYQLLTHLNDIFLKNSKEAIWQLAPIGSEEIGANTRDGAFYIIPPGSNPNPVFISPNLINSFEPNDNRKSSWIDTSWIKDPITDTTIAIYAYPFKYKLREATGSTSEYTIVFRLSEQYLIRAEARNELGIVIGSNSAQYDLNIIRNRAGLAGTNATTKDGMMNAILKERKRELFTEWGSHRWFDLKRTGQINTIMSIVTPSKEGNAWNPTQALYPIPASEFNLNPKLKGHQNPGYTEQ